MGGRIAVQEVDIPVPRVKEELAAVAPQERDQERIVVQRVGTLVPRVMEEIAAVALQFRSANKNESQRREWIPLCLGSWRKLRQLYIGTRPSRFVPRERVQQRTAEQNAPQFHEETIEVLGC